MNSDLDMQEIYEVFFAESLVGIGVMETGLLGLQDGAGDAETVRAPCRQVRLQQPADRMTPTQVRCSGRRSQEQWR